MARSLPLLLVLAACVPDAPGGATRYLCADGAEIAVVYAQQDDQPTATLTFDGQTLLLLQEPTASGARYGWPSDGTNYVWWTKADRGDLLFKDGSQGGLETPVHSDCAARG